MELCGEQIDKASPSRICDIFKRSSYREHCIPGGFLQTPKNFSLNDIQH